MTTNPAPAPGFTVATPTGAGPAPDLRHRRRAVLALGLHYVEMVLSMVVGMMLLAPVARGLFGAFGATAALEVTEVRAAVMATTMTLGMCGWMAIRGHRGAPIARMGAVMYLSFLVVLAPYWIGVITADAALMAGHVVMFPAMAAEMLWHRADYTDHHHTHEGRSVPGGARRAWAVLRRRWPTGLALVLSAATLLGGPSVLPAWVLALLGAEYLVIGSARRQWAERGLLAWQVAGFLVYLALAVVALNVDATVAGYLIGFGWLSHALWDGVLHRINKVVWRWYAEACAAYDIVIGVAVLVAVAA